MGKKGNQTANLLVSALNKCCIRSCERVGRHPSVLTSNNTPVFISSSRRSAYCAASVASLTNILTPKLFEDTTTWILRYNTPLLQIIMRLLKKFLCFSVIKDVFADWLLCVQVSELGGWSQRSAGSGGPRRLHVLWHGSPRHPGQRTHAGSQSLAGEPSPFFGAGRI